MAGYITLPRDIQNHWLWDNSRHLKYWLTIVLQATWCRTRYPFGGAVFDLERGQLVTSMRLLASKFGCSSQTVMNFLDMLEQARFIKRDSGAHGTIITILDYDSYQPPNNNDSSMNVAVQKRKSPRKTEHREEKKESKNKKTSTSLSRDEEISIFEKLRADEDYWTYAQNILKQPKETLMQHFEEFCNYLLATNYFHSDESDLRQHFINSEKKKMEGRGRPKKFNSDYETKQDARRSTPPPVLRTDQDDSTF